MRRTKMMWLSSLMFVTLLIPGIARADIDPDAEYATLMARLNEAGKSGGRKGTPNFATVQQEVNLRLQADLKDIDPLKIEPSKGLGWAQLFNLAGQTQNAIVAAQIFLNTNPAALRKYAAQMMILEECIQVKDDVGIVKLVPTFTAPNAMAAIQFSAAIPINIDIVAYKQGVLAALELLKQAETKIAFEQLKSPEEQNSGDFAILLFGMARADLFNQVGKQAEALAALEEARKHLLTDRDPFYAERIRVEVAHTQLIGTPAPPLRVERGYGTFPGLDAYKGKVVLLYFLEPMAASTTQYVFSNLKKMYSDLHNKGLEVVFVTTYVGEMDREIVLTEDAKFAKMKDFIAKQELTWPVLYLEKSTLAAYGFNKNDYPNKYIVIDQTGKFKLVKDSYLFVVSERVRKTIEELLNK